MATCFIRALRDNIMLTDTQKQLKDLKKKLPDGFKFTVRHKKNGVVTLRITEEGITTVLPSVDILVVGKVYTATITEDYNLEVEPLTSVTPIINIPKTESESFVYVNEDNPRRHTFKVKGKFILVDTKQKENLAGYLCKVEINTSDSTVKGYIKFTKIRAMTKDEQMKFASELRQFYEKT